MKQLFKEELKKIISYRMNKIFLFILLCWILLLTILTGLQESIIIDINSPRVNGKEAIQLQQTEFKKNAGIISNDKINDILINLTSDISPDTITDEDARAILYSKEYIKDQEIIALIQKTFNDDHRIDKSSNLFLAQTPINFYDTWKKKSIDEIRSLLSLESIEKLNDELDNIRPFEYDYSKGWQTMIKKYDDFMLGLLIIVSICLSNIFSEDKESNTSPILLSSKFGRKQYVATKMKAGITFTTILYFLSFIAYICGISYMYGLQGENASVQFGVQSFYIGNMSNLDALIKLCILGYIASLFMTFITMLLSSFQSTFKTSFFSILMNLIPFLMISYSGASPIFSCIFPIALTDLNNVFSMAYINIANSLYNQTLIIVIIIIIFIIFIYTILKIRYRKEK